MAFDVYNGQSLTDGWRSIVASSVHTTEIEKELEIAC